MIYNSARDRASLEHCTPGYPITYDLAQRVLRCAEGSPVRTGCGTLASLAAASLGSVMVAWNTPFDSATYAITGCQTQGQTGGEYVTVWAVGTAEKTAERVDVLVWNRNAGNAATSISVCCSAAAAP